MFKEARKKAGLSIQEAAFRLHIGSRTLVSYENGYTLMPPDVVIKAAEVYNEPLLCARYCTESCPIGQVFTQPVEVRSLAEAVLSLMKEYNDIQEMRNKLIEVAADGVITEDELPIFRKILDELLDLEQRIEELKLWAFCVLPVKEIIQKRKEKAVVGR